jgi:four helix bundle protein
MTNPNLDLRIRTKEFALRIIRLFQALPKTGEAQVIGKQVLRSSTSIGTQYREARRAKSGRNFISKMEGSLQELDETATGLKLLADSKILPQERLTSSKNSFIPLLQPLLPPTVLSGTSAAGTPP